MLLLGCGAGQVQPEVPAAAESKPPATPLVQADPQLPPALAVPAGQRPSFQADARGVQIYECRQDGEQAHWVLSAPEAELFDAGGNLAGKHYAGPTWESLDGSRVAATKQSEQAGEAGAIPWLLLRANEHQGSGALSAVTFIVRKNTRGGLPPSSGCDAAHGGDIARVPYSAVYVFYVPGA